MDYSKRRSSPPSKTLHWSLRVLWFLFRVVRWTVRQVFYFGPGKDIRF